jgi:hypothetical protein
MHAIRNDIFHADDIYSRFLDKMKFRGDEPLSGRHSLYNNVWNTWNWWCLTSGGIFSSINLDSLFIDDDIFHADDMKITDIPASPSLICKLANCTLFLATI